MSDVFAVETFLFGHEFVMGLFALGEFVFLFVQVDAMFGVLVFYLGVFVREFHAEQVFETAMVVLGDFRGTIDVEGEFKGLFFDEDHRGGMEAATVETGFTGDSVVIDFGGAVLEIFVVFLDLNEAEITAKTGKIPGLSFFAELFFTVICNLVEGEVALSEPETDLVQFFLSEVGHGGPVSFFSEV